MKLRLVLSVDNGSGCWRTLSKYLELRSSQVIFTFLFSIVFAIASDNQTRTTMDAEWKPSLEYFASLKRIDDQTSQTLLMFVPVGSFGVNISLGAYTNITESWDQWNLSHWTLWISKSWRGRGWALGADAMAYKGIEEQEDLVEWYLATDFTVASVAIGIDTILVTEPSETSLINEFVALPSAESKWAASLRMFSSINDVGSELSIGPAFEFSIHRGLSGFLFYGRQTQSQTNVAQLRLGGAF